MTKTVCCQHVEGSLSQWIRNDGYGAPVLMVDLRGPAVLSLTNQTIYIKCATCFQDARGVPLADSLSPDVRLDCATG
jgi:hypothetical protein